MYPTRMLTLLLALVIASCHDATDGTCVCTEEFRSYLVTVLDDAMQPAEGVTLTRTNLRTGRVIEPSWLGMPVPGVYLVADDGLLDEFSSDGDVVRVAFAQGSATATADFVFATPGPCRCHVELRSGPDTVVIGEGPP